MSGSKCSIYLTLQIILPAHLAGLDQASEMLTPLQTGYSLAAQTHLKKSVTFQIKKSKQLKNKINFTHPVHPTQTSAT
jgi:hypothetical protein